MIPATWLLVLIATNHLGEPTSTLTAAFATEAACDAAGDALRAPHVTAKCFPTGMGGMSRLSEDTDKNGLWVGKGMVDLSATPKMRSGQ